MKKYIAEDLPARKFPQASLSKGGENKSNDQGDDGNQESKTPEKRVRQAVYDIKYRARRENIPLRSAYSQYMQNSSMSEQEKALVREKLFGKGGIVKEHYNDEAVELASNSVAKALYKVFVQREELETNYDQLKNELEEAANVHGGDKKYKVRVTDKNGTSYVRYASREKINSLRANSNIQSVEMTEYGEPYEGERTRGERTAAATAGKDWDGDGKKESRAKEYRGVVHNAIQRRRGGNPNGKDTSSVKEEFLGEVKKNEENEDRVLDVMRGKNRVKVCKNNEDDKVNENAYSRFLNIISERKMTKSEVKKEKKLKTKYDDSSMKANMIKQYGPEKGKEVYFATIRKQSMKEESCGNDKKENEDVRSMPTKVNLVKNKLRSMGLKMSYEPDGLVISERGDEPGEGPRQRYGDMRGWDRSGPPTSFGGKWQSKERKAAGAEALRRGASSSVKPAD